MIAAGKLNRLVKLQSKSSTRDTSNGSVTPTFSDVANVWANIVSLQSSENEVAFRTSNTVQHIITIRYRTDVKPSWRVVLGTRVFSISGMIDTDDKHEQWELTCTEILNNG